MVCFIQSRGQKKYENSTVKMKQVTIGLSLILLTSACQTLGPSSQAEGDAAAATKSTPLNRDSITQVVTDSDAKLQWEDHVSGPVKGNYGIAIKHCDELDLAGQNDWRLPSQEELLVLAKASKADEFDRTPLLLSLATFDRTYWSSDTFSMGEPGAETVEFSRFSFDWGKNLVVYSD